MAPGRLLCFQGVKGGVGTSTLACLFGRVAARISPSMRVGLVDFAAADTSLLPSWMGIDPPIRSLEHLATLPVRRNSAALLEGYFSRTPEGLLYMPVHSSARDAGITGKADAWVPDRLADLLRWMDLLLLDLSSTDPAVQAVWQERSHHLLLVSEPDAASLTAARHAERTLLARLHPLETCSIWLNASRGGTLTTGQDALVPRSLRLSATVPHLGADLALRLAEDPSLSTDVERILRPAVQDVLRGGKHWATGAFPGTDGTPDPVDRDEPARDNAGELELASRLHQRLLQHFRAEGLLTGQQGMEAVHRAALEPRAVEALTRFIQEVEGIDRGDRQRLIQAVLDISFGLGPLEPLLRDPDVTEVMVNGPAETYIEREGRLERSPVRFLDEQQLRTVIERILSPIGRRIDESQPYADGRLPDGSRVNAVIPPLSLDGPILTIRKFAKRKLRVEDLLRMGSLTREAADFLGPCVKARKNVVVSGGTGSGKTTLLNILSGFIPETERIVTIEDSAELQLIQEHVVRLESRPANLEGRGRIGIRDLVINALRMRPDRIVVGEVRGGEALDMLQAMNTGHDGSLTTVHANSPRDALSRLETMCLMAGLELPLRAVREQLARAVHLVIQQDRLPGGRRAVTCISEVRGMDGDVVLMQDLFTWDDARGLVRRPLPPSFLRDLESQGYRLPIPGASPA